VSKHKSKTNVKVISSSGVSWTSKHGARRLMERGLAEMVGRRAAGERIGPAVLLRNAGSQTAHAARSCHSSPAG
jgi:hypothetical protein